MAILLVMLIHMFVLVPQTPLQIGVYNVLIVGWVGVDLFFVLSGFLITGILIDSRDSARYFGDFYIRRVCRIFPLFYAVAIFSFVVLPWTGLLPETKSVRFDSVGRDEIFYWLFLSNFAIAAAGLWRHGIMDVTWSLAIEEQFYLFWPFIVRAARNRLIPLCLALIAVSTIGRTIAELAGVNRVALYVLTFFRLDGLAAGAIVAVLWREWQQTRLRDWSRKTAALGLTGFLVSAMIGGTLAQWDSGAVTTAGLLFINIFFAGVLGCALCAAPGDRLYRFWTVRPLLFLGKLSFALYLFHLPIRAFIRDRLISPQWIATTPLEGFSGQLVFYAATMGVSCAIAWLSFHLYEKHFLALGRRLTRPTLVAPRPARAADATP